jgi:hypothetical protein
MGPAHPFGARMSAYADMVRWPSFANLLRCYAERLAHAPPRAFTLHGRPGAGDGSRTLPKPLFQVGAKVFKPAQGCYVDLHVLAVFFHDRQIE